MQIALVQVRHGGHKPTIDGLALVYLRGIGVENRRELVAPAALQPGELERLVEPEEVPDLLRPPLVLGEEVEEALDAQQLVDVVRLGVEDAPQDVLADARIRLDEGLPEAPVEVLPRALQVDDDVRLQLPQPLFLLLGHPIPPPACAP